MIRARLRRDASVAALAPLLLPEDDSARVMAAHRLVWSLMPADPDARRDFLWREEAPGRFLVLASRPPDASVLFDVEAKPFEPTLASGDRLRFMLRANPTVSSSSTDGRSARHDVVMHALRAVPQPERAAARPALAQQEGAAWLDRVGKQNGFAVEPGLRADGYQTLQLPRAGRAIQLGTLEYEGVLQVTDPKAFVARLVAGFGRAKAFGCGLMLVRRA